MMASQAHVLMLALQIVGTVAWWGGEVPTDIPPALTVRVLFNGDEGEGATLQLPANATEGLDLVRALTDSAYFTSMDPPPLLDPLPHFVSERALVFAANRGNLNAEAMASKLTANERIYLVPESRQFIHPSLVLGEERVLAVTGAEGRPIVLTGLSTRPRLFHIKNLITAEEIVGITAAATPTLKASTIGLIPQHIDRTKPKPEAKRDETRTSSNTWVEHTDQAKAIKNRAFAMLGTQTKIGEYDDRYFEGMHVIRYEPGQVYQHHYDYFQHTEAHAGKHNFAAGNGGSNRYATLFVYTATPEMGGQTYFSEPSGKSKRVPTHRVLNPDLPVANSTLETVLDGSPRESWLHHNGSWQRTLARQCFGKRGDGLSVYPKKGEAVLFYSQQPDGNLDRSSLHAGCPVLLGEKWAANLWVWNKPRSGQSQADIPPEPATPMTLTFFGVPETACRIFWVPEDGPEVPLGYIGGGGDIQYSSNTYNTHNFAFYSKQVDNAERNDGEGAGYVGTVTAKSRIGNKQKWKCSGTGVERIDESVLPTANGKDEI